MSKTMRLTMVEGQVKVINSRGNVVDIEIPEDIQVQVKTIHDTMESGISAAKEVVENNRGMVEIPDAWKNAIGILKGVDKLYYPMCSCCGSYVSHKQVQYSIDHYKGCVVCIDCQRKVKKEGKAFATPELRYKREDANYKKSCDNTKHCKKQVSGLQMQMSLHITGGQYSLCPKCLINYAGINKYPVKVKTEDVQPNF